MKKDIREVTRKCSMDTLDIEVTVSDRHTKVKSRLNFEKLTEKISRTTTWFTIQARKLNHSLIVSCNGGKCISK